MQQPGCAAPLPAFTPVPPPPQSPPPPAPQAARAATAANLLAAGYGAQCASGLRAAGEPCCYVDLVLRPPGDTRLASVYKPWARARLAAAGFELFAAFGDQFSDLNGDSSTQYAFKLPNSFYFIL